MGYITLYRKYRPQNFEDVYGQEHITKTLQNAIRDKKISHAYLFTGPRGTGKTTTARILAKALNCQNGPTPNPCGGCPVCVNIVNENIMDIIEIDAASNRGIDEMRDIKEQILYRPTQCRYKIYIIDEVHMLTVDAFNAFLKSLEEPPEHIIFILATTEPHKLLPTILSRCQRYNFKRIPDETIKNRIKNVIEKENITIDEQSTNLLTKMADGSLRDALSLLEQLAMYSRGNITIKDAIFVLGEVEKIFVLDYIDYLLNNDLTNSIKLIDDLVEKGKSFSSFLHTLTEYLKDIVLFQADRKINQSIFLSDEEKLKFEKHASSLTKTSINNIFDEIIKYEYQIKVSQHTRLFLELLTLKIISILNSGSEEIISPPKKYKDDKPEEYEKSPKPKSGEYVRAIELDKEEKVGDKKVTDEKVRDEKDTKSTVIEKPEQTTPPIKSEIAEKWSIVLDSIKKENMILFTFIYETNISQVDESTLLIEFNPDCVLQREKISETPKYKETISEYVKNVFGKPYKIKYRIIEETKLPQGKSGEQNSEIFPLIKKLFPESRIKGNI